MNTGKHVDDELGRRLMTRIAADENLHHLFFREVVTAALEAKPSQAVIAIHRQVRLFQMPGTHMSGFRESARVMADAGIYNIGVHHEDVIVPLVLRQWKLAEVDGLTGEADKARTAVLDHIDRLGRAARMEEAAREERAERSLVGRRHAG